MPDTQVEEIKTNDAGENTSQTIDETLAQRNTRYGSFKNHAEISQQLQNYIKMNIAARQQTIEPYMAEAITMICHKLARIANGDPYYDDSWRDIAGYAQLVVDTLNGKDI